MARRKGQPQLTVERIVEAALDLIDESGLDALSMRRLGTKLGVDPMAIYHHVHGKDVLLELVVRRVFDDIAPVDADADGDRGGRTRARVAWRPQVRRWADAYRAVARAHPNLVLRIVADPAVVAVAAVRINESLYTALEASGLPPKHVAAAADVIVDFVNGYVLAEADGPYDKKAAMAAFVAELDAQPAEAVAAQRRALDAGRPADHDGFAYGLDVLLSGLSTHIPAARKESS